VWRLLYERGLVGSQSVAVKKEKMIGRGKKKEKKRRITQRVMAFVADCNVFAGREPLQQWA
jgi:hypothetical protein